MGEYEENSRGELGQIFGFPKVLRVDPAGPWTSKAAVNYADEKHIDLVAIPAEAHHQIGIVEEAIKNLKAMLDTLTASFPSAGVENFWPDQFGSATTWRQRGAYSDLVT